MSLVNISDVFGGFIHFVGEGFLAAPTLVVTFAVDTCPLALDVVEVALRYTFILALTDHCCRASYVDKKLVVTYFGLVEFQKLAKDLDLFLIWFCSLFFFISTLSLPSS